MHQMTYDVKAKLQNICINESIFIDDLYLLNSLWQMKNNFKMSNLYNDFKSCLHQVSEIVCIDDIFCTLSIQEMCTLFIKIVPQVLKMDQTVLMFISICHDRYFPEIVPTNAGKYEMHRIQSKYHQRFEELPAYDVVCTLYNGYFTVSTNFCTANY